MLSSGVAVDALDEGFVVRAAVLLGALGAEREDDELEIYCLGSDGSPVQLGPKLQGQAGGEPEWQSGLPLEGRGRPSF